MKTVNRAELNREATIRAAVDALAGNECLEEETSLMLQELEQSGTIVREATPLVWEALEGFLPAKGLRATVKILAYNMTENTLTLARA